MILFMFVDVNVGIGCNVLIGELNGLDGEVVFDIEIVGVIVLVVKIVVYFVLNSDVGFI